MADTDALLAAVDPDTIAVVDMTIAQATPELCQKPARAWIAVPGEGLAPAEAPTVDALLAAGWWHVVAHPMPILAEELLATVQKLLRNDVFGLEKYVAWGAEVRTYTLEDARERDAAVATIAEDVTAVGLPDRIASLVSVIADELIANALYIAPLDDNKRRFRANDARERSRALRGRDVVTVRWATDARYLAIEVRDRWGTLDPHGVAASLASGKSSTTASENGMGLALAYACCNQLVVDLEPDVMTEMVALLDVRYKPTELGRSASFHTFVAAAPGES
ncbi:MAG TPA: ATP-binding protein [Kofleriaceae bacterium]|nr:ATP-binding protein [Kofleriaceae bacterium]